MHSRRLAQILTCVLTAVLLIPATAITAEAKRRKSKAVVSKTKGKSSKAKVTRSRSAKRSKRSRLARKYAEPKYQPEMTASIVPDRIEVLEFGSTNSAELSKWLNPPAPSNQQSGDVGTITPSRRVNIDSMRVIQIQQALTSKGFYSGETTGVYDEATINAMRQFQASQKIAATGYPTAHALKRLGLASW